MLFSQRQALIGLRSPDSHLVHHCSYHRFLNFLIFRKCVSLATICSKQLNNGRIMAGYFMLPFISNRCVHQELDQFLDKPTHVGNSCLLKLIKLFVYRPCYDQSGIPKLVNQTFSMQFVSSWSPRCVCVSSPIVCLLYTNGLFSLASRESLRHQSIRLSNPYSPAPDNGVDFLL